MIRCIAIDDEPLALTQLENYIRKTPVLELVKSCMSAIDALSIISSESIDLIFIDINMPDFNGLDFVRSLPDKPMIVFTTAYAEYAVEGFKVDALDYLLKPFGYGDFMRAVNKASRQYEFLASKKNISHDKTSDGEDGFLFIKADYKIVRIKISDIAYIESQNEYIRIFSDNEKPLMTLLSLKMMEEKLPEAHFMRVHRSYIVNLDKVKEISRNRIIFNEKTYIPIGDNYKEKFNSFLEKKFLGKNGIL